MEKITKSNEDYLEAILNLEKDGSAKSVDVANALGVSKPAVSLAMKELIEKGLVEKESYGDIRLTQKGRDIATKTFDKHSFLKNLLVGIGVSEQTAEIECCKIEHVMSDETINCLKKFYNDKFDK